MKLKLLIISALLSVCISCKAQHAAPVIKVLNGNGFKESDTVKYQVSSPQVIYYYVGLEQLLDNKWSEIILDISSGAPDRAAIIKKLYGNKPADGTYRLKNILPAYRKNGHVFRLKMSYGPAATLTQKIVVSNKFDVK